MKFSYWIEWLGVVFVGCVSPSQLIKIYQTGSTEGISLFTYIFLTAGLMCYLVHAIHIKSKVFTTAQALNLISTVWVLVLLI